MNNISLDKEVELIHSKQDDLAERLQEVTNKLNKIIIPNKSLRKHKRNKRSLEEVSR